jgi:FK506-binding nuclear protein
MRYIGKLTNGKVFDKNVSGKPFSFLLGRGEVIKGWDLGIAGMKAGGERKLTIPAPLAYGKRGAPPDIPKNATLVFDVKLLSMK